MESNTIYCINNSDSKEMLKFIFKFFMMKEKDNIFFFLKKGIKEKCWVVGMGVICHVMADDGV